MMLKFVPDAALQNVRDSVKAEFNAVKQAIANGENKSQLGSFQRYVNSKKEMKMKQEGAGITIGTETMDGIGGA